jgi:uncharacterized protein YyaL (SSP411 family)
VRKVLGEDAEFAMEVFDITEGGNWEGHTILTRPKTDSQEAKLRQMSEDDFRAKLRAVKARLLIARETRVKPARDEKILAAWNGLMIAAFAEAGSILDEQRYVHLAAGAAEFILTKMRTSSGGLLRTALADGTAKLPAYLEDYAFVIHGLLPLFQATGESKWLTAATELAGAMIRQFWDDKEGGFFFIGPEHEQLIQRQLRRGVCAVAAGPPDRDRAVHRAGGADAETLRYRHGGASTRLWTVANSGRRLPRAWRRVCRVRGG